MLPSDLLKINVNEHIEKKNGLSYLSWAWAWAEVIRLDPDASFEIHMFDGKPYQDVNGTGMVWVTVEMFKRRRSCWLPVMDYRNKPIPNPDAFQVNSSLMRCLVKAVAMHGLALYIYAGDDLPDEEVKKNLDIQLDPEEVKDMNDEAKSRELFAEGMIKFTYVCEDLNSLNSYWKANQAQLDKLKVSHLDLYKSVLEHFKTVKTKFMKEA
jgi:hypothetical protein